MIGDSDIAERARHRRVRPPRHPRRRPPAAPTHHAAVRWSAVSLSQPLQPRPCGPPSRRQAWRLPGRPAALAPLAVLVVEIAGQPVQVHPAGVASRHWTADLSHIDRQALTLLCQTPAAPSNKVKVMSRQRPRATPLWPGCAGRAHKPDRAHDQNGSSPHTPRHLDQAHPGAASWRLRQPGVTRIFSYHARMPTPPTRRPVNVRGK